MTPVRRLNKQKIPELAWLLLVVAASAFLYYNLRLVPAPGKLPGQIGPEVWPQAILVLLGLLAATKIFSLLLRVERADGASQTAEKKEQVPEPARSVKVLVMAVLALFAFALSIEFLGFPIGCFLFLLGFTIIGKWPHKAATLVISLLGTLGVLFLFSKIIYLPLPRGQFFFEDLTVNLYKVLGIF